ncbi:RagB/SusD family nutrient uptake outer membrane protein [Parasegetibacter sp. NRK P23]|uniref:RagB/SusD family nutrient uptake outer membrane protein n=1 Tax=Parasegetibacter sp. NRK P23 TaxID=2942999 RepID=UPI0020449BF5|nr:RagB/SusD family nutrient uptake outer membrane protein [Parasegetibacter sp. NRK P23]MCM5530476.1 RagB/SusD family nutrient uptake outer membrane protein [Parasegetibacter sp. NRK P23]
MNKFLLYTTLALGTLGLGSCSKGFLEVEPKGLNLESNYYRNETEAFNGLVAVYDVVGWTGGGLVTKVNALDAASDDHLAGGGNATDVNDLQLWSNYTLSPDRGPQGELWRKGFSGVFRANILLQKMGDVPMDETLKKRYIAEAKLLRGYFYFDLVRLFKNVPLFTEPVPASDMYNVTQAAPADVYAQIVKDMQEAIPDLPPTVPAATEGGRMTQGIAHALLGKVYLQLERFNDAAAEFAVVNGTPGGTSQYGYKLLDNFSDLWKSNNKFNTESIFEIGYTSTSSGDWGCIACTEGNVLSIMTGPRGYSPLTPGAPDYVSGWSFLVVTPGLFNAIHFDPRYNATIANLDSLKANGIADYTPGYNNTGYFLEKFIGRQSNRSTGGGAMELNFPQNMYEIRLADTYLLEAEAILRGSGGNLTRGAALLNAVRDRVGLGPVALTLDNIVLERRLELAGEGHRWFDLVRWGRAAAALASKGFVAGKHEVLPIPLLELENTKLVQNEEYR